MCWQRIAWLGLGLAFTSNPLVAAEVVASSIQAAGGAPICPPEYRPPPQCPAPAIGTGQPNLDQPSPLQPGAVPPATDAFAQAPRGGTGETGSFDPNMFGDLLASQVCGPLTRTFNGQTQALQPGTNIGFIRRGTIFNFDTFNTDGSVVPAGTPFPNDRQSLPTDSIPPRRNCAVGSLALVARGAFKITENESPHPQDRVFTTYNFFDNVLGSFNPPGLDRTTVHREVIGFEKTFIGGDASFGLRLPFVQLHGDAGISSSDIGDLSFILKYALINDRTSNNVLSTGMVITVPTGGSFLPEGTPDIHPTLLQPFLGGVYNIGNGFVQGFSAILVPTDSRDVTYWFNDLAIGYFLYRNNDCNRWITAVIPTIEVHVNTPLNHRGSQVQPIGGSDIVDLTYAATIGLCRDSTLGLGIVTPVTGPKPFDWELQVQFNYRF